MNLSLRSILALRLPLQSPPRYFFSTYFNTSPSVTPEFTKPGYLQKASKLFARCQLEATLDLNSLEAFYGSVDTKVPRKEFIMFGRSNIGKSSLINSLVRNNVALVSNTPGKTQMLYSYKLASGVYLIDCPGFGFTSGVEKKKVDSWKRLMQIYLNQGYCHRALCLVDAEHGFKQSDTALFKYLQGMHKFYMLVYTKCDKKAVDTSKLPGMKEELKFMTSVVHLTSSKTQSGIEELRKSIAAMMQLQSV